MKLRSVIVSAAPVAALLLGAMGAALAFGGPARPKPMQSISAPFRNVDFSSMPHPSHYSARDGTPLAYHHYAPTEGKPSRGTVVLVHGSSSSSRDMHPLAQSFAQAGFAVDALDVRGHGESGPRGDIAYLGQLDDDMEDFVRAVQPAGPKTLVGFSAGGGFAIRMAGGTHQALFDNYLFMAPYTNRRAPNYRPNAGGWVSIGVPRIVALKLLNRAGIRAFNHLSVADFAVADPPDAELTPSYSYALIMNFQADEDYQHDIHEIHQPAAVLVGSHDEVFIADKFAQVFADAGRPDIPITLVPDTGHISLTLTASARAAAVAAVERLDRPRTP